MTGWNSACLLMLLAGSAQGRAQTFLNYSNERYGFYVAYPAGFTMDPPPENGDGRTLTDGKGCSITVFGGNNVLEQTLKDAIGNAAKEFDEITYRSKGAGWFVMSGFKGADVLYIKGYLGKGSSNQLWIRYPRARSKELSVLTTKVSRSFKPGGLDEYH